MEPRQVCWSAGLLAAYRFIADTAIRVREERLDNLEDPYRLFRCRTIMNCVDVCPKGVNPTKAIGKIKGHAGQARCLIQSVIAGNHAHRSRTLENCAGAAGAAFLENDIILTRLLIAGVRTSPGRGTSNRWH